MCTNEIKWLQQCPIEFKPVYYRRYVDDTFMLFNKESDVPLFLDYMNSRHPNIRFTCEVEKDKTLPFLDINIMRDENGIITSVYRKPTYTGLGLNWFSFCPNIYKLNSIKTLLNRAFDICSTYTQFHEEVVHLKGYFIKNNYLEGTFYNILRSFLCSKRDPPVLRYDVPKQRRYIKFPFYGKPSFVFRKKVLAVLNSSFPSVDFRIIFTNNYTIGSFFGNKDSVPDSVCSNIAYEFECPSCNARYIGCSSRAFKCRVMEHIGRSYRTGQYLNRMPFSSVRNHSQESDHPFSDKNFRILARFSSNQEALMGEKILISKEKPALNININ